MLERNFKSQVHLKYVMWKHSFSAHKWEGSFFREKEDPVLVEYV